MIWRFITDQPEIVELRAEHEELARQRFWAARPWAGQVFIRRVRVEIAKVTLEDVMGERTDWEVAA